MRTSTLLALVTAIALGCGGTDSGSGSTMPGGAWSLCRAAMTPGKPRLCIPEDGSGTFVVGLWPGHGWSRRDRVRLSVAQPGVIDSLPAAMAVVLERYDDAVRVKVLHQVLPGINGALAEKIDGETRARLGKFIGRIAQITERAIQLDVGAYDGVQVGDVYQMLAASDHEPMGRLRITSTGDYVSSGEVLDSLEQEPLRPGMETTYLQNTPEADALKSTILVLNFIAPAGEAAAGVKLGEQLARSLADALEDKARGSRGVTVVHGVNIELPRSADEEELHREARRWGQRLRADLVLWGFVRCPGDGQCVLPRYTVVDRQSVAGSGPVGPNGFQLSFRQPLPAAPAPLAAAVMGLVAVQEQRPVDSAYYLSLALRGGALRGEDQLQGGFELSRALWAQGQAVATIERLAAVVGQARSGGDTAWTEKAQDAIRKLTAATQPPIVPTQPSADPTSQAVVPAPPPTGDIQGSVMDVESGTGVAAAIVELTGADGKETTVTADGNGNFTFKDLAPGLVTLKVDAAGFMFGGATADVRANDTTRPQIQLAKRPKVASVKITGNELKITKQVHFEATSAKILGDSNALLSEVADTILRTPAIKRLEIQGHTDNTGDRDTNLALSQQRAEAIRNFLISSGVEASRLTAKGYGQRYPIAPNISAANRAKNRRMQFVILDGPGTSHIGVP